MSMNKEVLNLADLQMARDEYIKEMDKAENKTKFAENNAESLYAIGLTMYSSLFSFESVLFNSFATSTLDDTISLHPEQLKVIEIIKENKGMIFSAPTSFGKTFVVFEYIARYKPQNVVMVVPTLALIDEYKRKIINQYRNIFGDYKVYLSIEKGKEYNWNGNNIFIVTHDRVVNEDIHEVIPNIDFLIIDEVYKLQKDENDDRVLILNLAYYNLVSLSQKYVLLAPFIKGVENLDKLEDTPIFHSTNYSPVVNEVNTIPIIDDLDRIVKTNEILKNVEGNTLIYFPTVKELNDYIEQLYENEFTQYSNEALDEFIDWAKKEIHEKWSVIHAMKCGYLVHHGQLPLGIRMIELDLFNNIEEKQYTKMLCTATLLEGVNTTAKNIIITKPARGNGTPFDAFDFYNLVGRTGRLFKHYLGKAFYIKGPNDRPYIKNEALKSIEFELTSDSIDIDINNGNYQRHQNFIDFLNALGVDYETYKTEIASKCRFSTVLYLFGNYCANESTLLAELNRQITNDAVSKLEMVRRLYEIVCNNKKKIKLKTYIINKLTYLTRPNIKSVVNDTLEVYTWEDVNDVIKETINLKNSYIEYEFYKRIQIILFFMRYRGVEREYIEIIQDKLLKNIEVLYYINLPAQKMLKDMGVYDGDIDTIISVIGSDFETVENLRNRVSENIIVLDNISVVSKYVLKRLLV